MLFVNNLLLINFKVGMYDLVNLVEYEMYCKLFIKYFIFVIYMYKNFVIILFKDLFKFKEDFLCSFDINCFYVVF